MTTARTYVHAMNCIHYMHDKYFYERLEMALHDAPVENVKCLGNFASSPFLVKPGGESSELPGRYFPNHEFDRNVPHSSIAT